MNPRKIKMNKKKGVLKLKSFDDMYEAVIKTATIRREYFLLLSCFLFFCRILPF